jgi:hypothetical protein
VAKAEDAVSRVAVGESVAARSLGVDIGFLPSAGNAVTGYDTAARRMFRSHDD